MTGDRARSALAGTRFADVRWVDQTGSTNQDLLAEAAAGAPDGRVLVADHQTAGRGRLDRSWVAPPESSLLVSVLVRPRLARDDAPLLTVAMALAVREAAGARHVAASLKWPNDVVVDGQPPRKLAGILAESAADAEGRLLVIVGVGVNVNWPVPLPSELESLAGAATALNLESGGPADREDVLADVLRSFERRCQQLEAGDSEGRADLVAAARNHSATLGRRVRADLGAGTTVEGVAVDLEARGDLVVVTDDGSRHVILAGDVVHLRPT